MQGERNETDGCGELYVMGKAFKVHSAVFIDLAQRLTEKDSV